MLRLCFFLCVAMLGITAFGQQTLILPTKNDNLLRGKGSAYYMYVDRDFQGVKSKPWEGGQYGMVRSPRETSAGVVYSRFHEGMDIRPLYYDAQRVPQDVACAVDAGTVVHVNEIAGYSNYGKYVVVEHWWDGCPYYSLYAHLREVKVAIGQRIAQGTPLGLLGWTGAGINKERSHLHFEINLLVNKNFETWFAKEYPAETNRHGMYNGWNLIGIDVAKFYLARQQNQQLSISQFLRSQPAFFRVVFPAKEGLDILKRYPWLVSGGQMMTTQAWEIHFNPVGVPVKAEPYTGIADSVRLTGIHTAKAPYQFLTRGLVAGSTGNAHLSQPGVRSMGLFSFSE